jgi:hypothetical protein
LFEPPLKPRRRREGWEVHNVERGWEKKEVETREPKTFSQGCLEEKQKEKT